MKILFFSLNFLVNKHTDFPSRIISCILKWQLIRSGSYLIQLGDSQYCTVNGDREMSVRLLQLT